MGPSKKALVPTARGETGSSQANKTTGVISAKKHSVGKHRMRKVCRGKVDSISVDWSGGFAKSVVLKPQ